MTADPQREFQHAVDLVHRTLEILKYVGHESKGKPTGEGVPVDIVTLPDLLFDFRSMYINDPEGRPCSIGGRAALAACSLLHLLSREDHTFRCRLLTKTGELGILLLTNELSKGESLPLFDNDGRDLIVVRAGDPRCALRYYVDDKQQVVLCNGSGLEERILAGVGSDDSNLELGFDDFSTDPLLAEVIKRSTVTYFSSVRTRRYCTLLQKLVDLCSEGSQTQFLCDLTLSDYNERNAISEVMRYLEAIASAGDETKSSLFAGVFVPESGLSTIHHLTRRADSGDETPGALAEGLNLYVVTYGESAGVAVFGPRRTEIARIGPGTIDFARQHVPERFKAGVILAYAVHRALAEVKAYNLTLAQQLEGEWSRTSAWEVCVRYGGALANAAPRAESSFASLETLFTAYQQGDPHYPQALNFDPEVYRYLANTPEPFRSPGLDNRVMELARLAGFRRTRTLGQYPWVCICTPAAQWCEACEKRGGKDRAVAAVMIDLDGTLLDSTRQRGLSLRAALEKILPAVMTAPAILREAGCPPDVMGMLEFFETYVYDLWPLYQRWEYGDFRQQWNTEGWYVILIALLENRYLFGEIHEIVKRCTRNKKLDAAALRRVDREDPFSGEFAQVKSKYADVITEAMRRFELRPMSAFREAFDFLSTLQQIPGVRLYMATEGHADTQALKLKRLGIGEFFLPNRLLTTEEAAEPADLTATIRAARNTFEERISSLVRECAHLRALSSLESEVERELEVLRERGIDVTEEVRSNLGKYLRQKAGEQVKKIAHGENKIAYIRRQQDCLDRLAAVLTRMGEKTQVTFYAAATRAILRDPDNPRQKLKSFDALVEDPEQPTKMKFAMVGDRQDKDIAPTRELLGPGILTVRIQSAKYAGPEHHNEKEDRPHIVVDTLAQAKAMLLSEDVWGRVRCVYEPRLFDCVVLPPHARHDEANGLAIDAHVVFNGIDMIEYDRVHKAYLALLSEHLASERGAAMRADLGDEILKTLRCARDRFHTGRVVMVVVSSVVLANICQQIEASTLLKFVQALKEAMSVAAACRREMPDEYDSLFGKAMEKSKAALNKLRGHPAPEVSSAARVVAGIMTNR